VKRDGGKYLLPHRKFWKQDEVISTTHLQTLDHFIAVLYYQRWDGSYHGLIYDYHPETTRIRGRMNGEPLLEPLVERTCEDSDVLKDTLIDELVKLIWAQPGFG
jgi:hypothetical protein